MNRCIDVLLTHSPINAFEPQPDLTGEEYAEGYILRLSNPASANSSDGQHIFGDRRHAIYTQHMNRMRAAHTDSDSQGTVKKCDQKQYQEIAQLARTLGEKNPTLPATFIAIVCNNLQGFYTYPESPQQPCRLCQATNGTSSRHFLECPMLEDTRRPFIQEIAEHLAKIAQNSRLTTAQITKSLFPIEEAANRHNPFPQRQPDDEDDPKLPDYEEIRQEDEDNDNANPDDEQAAQREAEIPQIETPSHSQQQPNEPCPNHLEEASTVIRSTKRQLDAPAQQTDEPNHKSLRRKETAELQSEAENDLQQPLDQTQTSKRHRDDQPRPAQTHKFPRLNETTLENDSLNVSLTTQPRLAPTTETPTDLANRPSKRKNIRALPPQPSEQERGQLQDTEPAIAPSTDKPQPRRSNDKPKT